MDRLEELVPASKKFSETVAKMWSTAQEKRLDASVMDVVETYKVKLLDEASDLLKHCKDLIDGETELRLRDYFKIYDDYEKIANDGYKVLSGVMQTPWNACLELFLYCGSRGPTEYERREKEGTHKYTLDKYGNVFRYKYNNEECKFALEPFVPAKYTIVIEKYCMYRDTIQYKICSRVYGYYIHTEWTAERVKERKTGNGGGKRYETDVAVIALVELVCLYIALKNEGMAREEDAEIKGLTLPKARKVTQEEEKMVMGSMTLEEKMESREWALVFTPRAKEYFGKAIKEGWMAETEHGYEWTFACEAPELALAYFCYRVYNMKRPPYKKLGYLFGKITDPNSKLNPISKNAYKLLKETPWYEDYTSIKDNALSKEEKNKIWNKLPQWFKILLTFFHLTKKEDAQ